MRSRHRNNPTAITKIDTHKIDIIIIDSIGVIIIGITFALIVMCVATMALFKEHGQGHAAFMVVPDIIINTPQPANAKP